MLRIENKSPKEECITVYLNGEPTFSNEVSVPNKFHIKFAQYRTSLSSDTAVQTLIQLIFIFLIGGRTQYGVEYSSPGWAVWEVDCEISTNSSLSVDLVDNSDFIEFKVAAEDVRFANVISKYDITIKGISNWLASTNSWD